MLINPPVPDTQHQYPYDDLSPADFERLVYWLVRRSGEFDHVEWNGGGPNRGCDVVAYRHTSVEREVWYISCMRAKRISPRAFEHALYRLFYYSSTYGPPPLSRSDEFVFAVACPIRAKTRELTSRHARSHDLPSPHYWGQTELDVRIAKFPEIECEFFLPVSPAASRQQYRLQDLSSDDFGRLVYTLVDRSTEFEGVQWQEKACGARRDLIAWKHTAAGKEEWYIRCMQHQHVTSSELDEELGRLEKDIREGNAAIPDAIVFATRDPVSPTFKNRTVIHASELGVPRPYYWGRLELDERIKSQPKTEEEFFRLLTSSSSRELPQLLRRSNSPKVDPIVIGKRFALIIANSKYKDESFGGLIAPRQDAEGLARVLSDPDIGAFDVQVLYNEPSHKVIRAIDAFFKDRKRDDLLLLFISGHGTKDVDDLLYLATVDSERELLLSTAVPTASINKIMERSHSRQQIWLLDCCYSGAFAEGMTSRADRVISPEKYLGGQGRVVLTATDSVRLSYEPKSEKQDVLSFFTSAMVSGLETGEAAQDGGEYVSVRDLYNYVYEKVTEKTPLQQPQFWTFEGKGESIVLARNPNPTSKLVI